MRTIRSPRSGRRRRRQLHRRQLRRRQSRLLRRQSRQRLLIALTGLVVVGLLAGAYLLTSKEPLLAAATRYRCVEVVGADRSGSQSARAVVDRWRDEADTIVNRAADCEGLIVAEDVYAQPGKSEVREISLRVQGLNRLDEEQKRKTRVREAKAAVEEVLGQPASGGTNLIGWFHQVGNHLQGLAGKPTVHVTLFTDGINTMAPVNMLKADLSRKGVTALLDRLGPDLPDCSDWRISMLGVDATSQGGVPQEVADGAERFWRAFIGACHGKLLRYDRAAQMN